MIFIIEYLSNHYTIYILCYSQQKIFKNKKNLEFQLNDHQCSEIVKDKFINNTSLENNNYINLILDI